MMKSARGAFTLIEVLVVVAIIALLVSILLPSLNAAREQTRIVLCKTRLEHLFKGHAFYASDNKGFYPDADWWLWDGIDGSMRGWFPSLYSKTGNVRPTDSRRWVEFGHIYRYVKDKEIYFCPKDTKRRRDNSIGGGGNRGSFPIHSYVRFWEPHEWFANKFGAGNTIPNGTLPALLRSDFLRPEMLRHRALRDPTDGNVAINSTPNRMGLMFEELQNFDEPPAIQYFAANKENTLNDAYSGWVHFTDWPSWRHSKNKSHTLYWDGHISLIEADKVYRDGSRNFARWLSTGGQKP